MPDETNSTSNYPLLEFEYDKSIYEAALQLNPHPAFMDTIPPSSEDYMHDEFGFYDDDDTNALAHTVYVLKGLEAITSSQRFSRDHATLLWELSEDFSHYCFCVKYGSGSKETLFAFMEAMLFYGCDKRVYDEVVEWNRAANEGEYPSEDQIFNFDALYIKMGDRFLFLDNNISAALKFYSLPTLKWHVDRSASSKLAKNYSVEFDQEYETLADLARGNFYISPRYLRSRFMQLYNKILVFPSRVFPSEEKASSELLSLVAEYAHLAHDLMESSFGQKRIVALMTIVLTQKLLITELARLADDPGHNRAKKDLVIRKAALLKGTPFQPLASAAHQLTIDPTTLSYDDYLQLVKAAHLSDLLLTELSAEDSSRLIAYYTSSEVFSYMLPEKCTGEKKDRLGRLTVMHLSYMNDPNEGQTLRKALAGRYDTEKKGRKQLNVPYVFIKCFSPRIDYLPMWEMYGDHARGCCLVINWVLSKPNTKYDDPTLYRVCYLRKTDGRYRADPSDNQGFSDSPEIVQKGCTRINAHLDELAQIADRLPQSLLHYFDDILDKVRYLFKDSSYSYEQELRVIYQTKDNILHTDGDKPWLFVQTPFPLQLDEVILGPKFPDVSTRVPYLQEQLDLMCEKTGTEKPLITLSEIDYR